MNKKYYVIEVGTNKYGIPQFIYNYNDCDYYDISHVPKIMDRKMVNILYKKVIKDYHEKIKPFNRRDIRFNLQIKEYNS